MTDLCYNVIGNFPFRLWRFFLTWALVHTDHRHRLSCSWCCIPAPMLFPYLPSYLFCVWPCALRLNIERTVAIHWQEFRLFTCWEIASQKITACLRLGLLLAPVLVAVVLSHSTIIAVKWRTSGWFRRVGVPEVPDRSVVSKPRCVFRKGFQAFVIRFRGRFPGKAKRRAPCLTMYSWFMYVSNYIYIHIHVYRRTHLFTVYIYVK